MATKWLDMALKRQKPDAPLNGANGARTPDKVAPTVAAPPDRVQINSDTKNRPRPHGDLQSAEDIYRAAGIINPRMGYSITKVIEMINSDHLRNLPDAAKRAAVLMALDAAGVSTEEILRDARMRQEALDAYEAGQRKHFEEYWARKAEANNQLQAEMEQVAAEYLGRIERTLDEITTEKAAFAKWQATKQREVDRISEAVGVCLKDDVPDPVNSQTPVSERKPEVKVS